METTETPDTTMRRTFVWVALGALAVVTVGFVFFGARVGLGALAGALVSVGNLAVLVRSVQKLFAGAGTRYGVVVVFKFAGLIGLTYALLNIFSVDPLGLALGFGALPLGLVLGGGLASLTNRDQ
jgi:hypothetical protein